MEHTGPMRMVWHDEFLRAVIDRRTGTRSMQVYAWVIYSGSLRNYVNANYPTADGTRSVSVTALAKEVMNCPVGDCTYTERIAFPVDEESLRQLSTARAPGIAGKWSYRLVAKSGPEFSGELSTAEVAGFLAKIDEYASRPPAEQSSAPVSVSRDLGIGGMAVDATEEYPKRAGILVTGVNPGSVAHKAGIIVGDILYELDGHRLKTPADLQAALAARTATSPVAIKLYRGISDTTVSARF
jgi:hypothetical protein